MSVEGVPFFFVELPGIDEFDEVVQITFFERIFKLETYPVLVDVGSRQVDTGLSLSMFVDTGFEEEIDPASPPILEALPQFRLVQDNKFLDMLIRDLYDDSKFPGGHEELDFNHIKIVLVEARRALNWDRLEESKKTNQWLVFQPENIPTVEDIISKKLLEWRS